MVRTFLRSLARPRPDASRSHKAPVGHVLTHRPQISQVDSFSGRSKAVLTRTSIARPLSVSASAISTSAQIFTHRWQRTHFEGS